MSKIPTDEHKAWMNEEYEIRIICDLEQATGHKGKNVHVTALGFRGEDKDLSEQWGTSRREIHRRGTKSIPTKSVKNPDQREAQEGENAELVKWINGMTYANYELRCPRCHSGYPIRRETLHHALNAAMNADLHEISLRNLRTVLDRNEARRVHNKQIIDTGSVTLGGISDTVRRSMP